MVTGQVFPFVYAVLGLIVGAVCIAMGFIEPRPGGIRVREFEALPQTATL
jgi:hypothetical protein